MFLGIFDIPCQCPKTEGDVPNDQLHAYALYCIQLSDLPA